VWRVVVCDPLHPNFRSGKRSFLGANETPNPAIADIECGDHKSRSKGGRDEPRHERDNSVDVRGEEGQSVGQVHTALHWGKPPGPLPVGLHGS